MEWYLKVLKQYGDFSGRARRKEYWMFVLFNIIFTGIATLISPKLYAIYTLAVLIPNLAVSVRRLHDINKSGWWLLISLTGIGNLLLLYWFLLPSDNNNIYN